MRTLLTLIAVAGLARDARAVVFPGSGTDYGIYNVSVTPPVVVGTTSSGNDLLSVTLRISNISGDPAFDINGIADVTIGSNGTLHHEQAPNPVPVFAYPTPLVESFTILGQPASSVDSHFLVGPNASLPSPGAPSETFSTAPSGVPAEVLPGAGFTTATTGFGGVLTASYPFAATLPSWVIAYLVFEDEGFFTRGIDFTFRPTNAAGQSETITDCIGTLETPCIPEPSAALLVALATVGVAPRRSR